MSLLSAIASLEQVTPTMQEDLTIIMDDGRYQVDETIALTELEGGKNGFNVIFKAASGAHPIISGGIAIENWQGPDAKGIYHADVPEGVSPRMLLTEGKLHMIKIMSKTTITIMRRRSLYFYF